MKKGGGGGGGGGVLSQGRPRAPPSHVATRQVS